MLAYLVSLQDELPHRGGWCHFLYLQGWTASSHKERRHSMISLKGDIRRKGRKRRTSTHLSVRYWTKHALPPVNAENTPTKHAKTRGYYPSTYNNLKSTIIKERVNGKKVLRFILFKIYILIKIITYHNLLENIIYLW